MPKFFIAFILSSIIFIVKSEDKDAGTGIRYQSINSEKKGEENPTANRNKLITGAKLIDDPRCSEDLKRVCRNAVPSQATLNNFDVLECVQNQQRDDSALINEDCHHILWSYKYNLTQSAHVEDLAKGYCKEDLKTFRECSSSESAYGNVISCMIQNINQIMEDKCRHYIIRLGTIVFSDYHLVQHLTDGCKGDIEKYSCGRIQSRASSQAHSQGLTIECLSKHSNQLEGECRKQIFRLAELQSEDFHLDRAFYFACRSERDKFCRSVKAGKGQVYKCLLHHKDERTMSHECAEQLSRRQNLIVSDYQVSRSLLKACRNAIKENHCRKGVGREESDLKLSKILLCLEGALRKNQVIEGECQEEIIAHRQMMIEISPKIVENCKSELMELCGEAVGPAKLHCLIKHFRTGKNHKRISDECKRALEDVVKVSDPAEDWRVDPILHEACLPVVQSRCQDLKAGHGRVMRCLMRHMNSQYMEPNCEAALLEIQYFVARDWKLDPQLYQSCRNDSINFCHAQHDWTASHSVPGADGSILVLPCLFRYAYHPSPELRLSATCADDVRRVMHERAAFVQLHPQIEMECLEPLALLCSDNTGPGEEMMCLQKNMEKLDGPCLVLIKNYTEAESKDVGLNNLVMTYCSGVMEQLCSHVLLNEEMDEGAVLDCLIRNKNIPAMREHFKCRAVVENFQVIMIKDFAFTPKFKQECHTSVQQYCSQAQNRKEVLDCLSQRILYDVLNEDRSSIAKACKQQVRKQLSQRHESINLDPDLKRICHDDVSRFCDAVAASGMTLECLREHRASLSAECHHVVFQREKEESVDPTIDVVLMKNCREMIKTFCGEAESGQMLACLVHEKDNSNFDMKCRSVLLQRMVEHTKDIRLSPDLFIVCKADAQKFCKVQMDNNVLVERNGKVIDCLKQVLPLKKLSHRCELKVIQITTRAALNYKMDPVLIEKCDSDMLVLCPSYKAEASEKGEVEECLKLQLEHNKILNEECKVHVADIMRRERADIHADPLLYRTCSIDDTKYCAQLDRGMHLACLFDVLDRNPTSLERGCREKLRERREMFKIALKVTKLETVEDLVEGVRSSPQRNFFLVILFTVIGFIFIGGLTCGRVTRRSYKLMKNR